MTISFKRISRNVPVLFALALILLSAVTVMLPTKHAYADNSITQPLVWTGNDHANLVDAKNHVFIDLGWFCPQAGNTKILDGSGGNFSINDSAKASSKTISVPGETEAGNSVNNVDVPKCDSQKGQAANHIWVTQFPDGTNFALYVYGLRGDNSIDAQHMPIHPGTGMTAKLAKIDGGSLKDIATLKDIKVDASKAGVVDAGKASNSKDTTPTDTCPVTTWGLRWIACPLVEAARTAIEKLEAIVSSWMANDVEGIFGGSNACSKNATAKAPSCAYYMAWNSFRVLAVSLIIIAGIIMVVSEASGLAIFDAYTIRKVLPRLLISVILIAISWWLMKFVVQFFNNISIWLASLVSWPFHSITNSHVTTSTPWTVVGQYGIILGAILALGPFGILSYAGTIFLALAVGWITLVIRRMLIILAIVSAPLFIACFIMPNTEKMGKFWRDGFIGLLLMGPVFTLAVTIGQITAAVASRNNNGDPFGIVSFACLVIPFLAIPVLFSKIGGSVASLIGFVNDKSKGGFDRLKNYRTNEVQRRKERAKSGELFGAGMVRGGAADKLNGLTTRAALGARGNFGIGRKGQQAYEQRMNLLSAQHAKSEAGQAGQFNDDMLMVQSQGSISAGAAHLDKILQQRGFDASTRKERVANAVAAAKANGGTGRARQVYAAKQLAVTGTGYDNAQEMLQTIAAASGGNEALIASMVGEARSASKRAGRDDLGGPSFQDLFDTAVGESRAMSGQKDAQGNTYTAPNADHYRGLAVKAFQNTDGATLSRNKGASIKNITTALYDEIASTHLKAQAAARNGDEDGRRQLETHAAALTEQVKNFQQTAGMYAAPSHSQTIYQNITKPDRGERRADGTYDGPQIMQTITQQSTANPGRQQVVYRREADRAPDGSETNVRFVQETRTVGAAPAPHAHMQESAEIFRNTRRGGGDDNPFDPRLGRDE